MPNGFINSIRYAWKASGPEFNHTFEDEGGGGLPALTNPDHSRYTPEVGNKDDEVTDIIPEKPEKTNGTVLLTRRQMLKAMGLVGAGAAIGALTPQVVPGLRELTGREGESHTPLEADLEMLQSILGKTPFPKINKNIGRFYAEQASRDPDIQELDLGGRGETSIAMRSYRDAAVSAALDGVSIAKAEEAVREVQEDPVDQVGEMVTNIGFQVPGLVPALAENKYLYVLPASYPSTPYDFVLRTISGTPTEDLLSAGEHLASPRAVETYVEEVTKLYTSALRLFAGMSLDELTRENAADSFIIKPENISWENLSLRLSGHLYGALSVTADSVSQDTKYNSVMEAALSEYEKKQFLKVYGDFPSTVSFDYDYKPACLAMLRLYARECLTSYRNGDRNTLDKLTDSGRGATIGNILFESLDSAVRNSQLQQNNYNPGHYYHESLQSFSKLTEQLVDQVGKLFNAGVAPDWFDNYPDDISEAILTELGEKSLHICNLTAEEMGINGKPVRTEISNELAFTMYETQNAELPYMLIYANSGYLKRVLLVGGPAAYLAMDPDRSMFDGIERPSAYEIGPNTKGLDLSIFENIVYVENTPDIIEKDNVVQAILPSRNGILRHYSTTRRRSDQAFWIPTELVADEKNGGISFFRTESAGILTVGNKEIRYYDPANPLDEEGPFPFEIGAAAGLRDDQIDDVLNYKPTQTVLQHGLIEPLSRIGATFVLKQVEQGEYVDEIISAIRSFLKETGPRGFNQRVKYSIKRTHYSSKDGDALIPEYALNIIFSEGNNQVAAVFSLKIDLETQKLLN